VRTLAVAVLARPAAELDGCLSALERAGVSDPAVVRIGADGAAMARNHALAACDAEVLALVEDDVAVDAGWYEALVAFWADADAALATAAGPLRAAFPGGRPEWLSDDLVDAFATMDLGDEPALVDAGMRTFHAGNVSFRADALRAVGGFWPARGHCDGRDWFSEEHEAQRELARAGWSAAYVPGAAAARIVTGDARRWVVLRRRLRYGARRALIGEHQTTRATVLQLATSAAGVPIALAGRRAQLAMERAVRVAESAGALIAGPLAHRDLQPVTRDTPIRAGLPPPQPRRRRRSSRDGPVILLYHRVVERDSDPLGVCVSPANFMSQLEVLKAEREIRPLGVLASDAPPNAAAVTFDDGYQDNLDNAAPALAAGGVPATLFVATGHVAEGRGFWWDEVERLLRTAPEGVEPVLTLELAGQRRAFRTGRSQERRIAREHLQRWLQPMAPELIDSALAAIRAWAGVSPEASPAEADRPMTPDGLRAFVGMPGLAAGAHSRSHRSLRYAGAAGQDAEILGSRDDLTAWLGVEPTCFSYPFGVPGADLDVTVAARVRAAGYSLAVTTTPGVIAGADRFMLPRRVVPDVDGEAFEEWLRTPAAGCGT
jgi:peptidoglycan/xylan/chitin deacetylase (PgdA/CDA1 family)